MDLEKSDSAGKHYFTGKPCKNGHIANRFRSSRMCVECAKAKDLSTRSDRLKYFMDYQKRNPEQAIAAQEKYRESNRELMREKDRARKQNPETKQKRAAYERARRQNKRAGGG